MEIDGTVRFLAAFDPDGHRALRARHPQEAAALQPYGETLGEIEDSAAVDALRTSLAAMTPVAHQAMEATGRKLRATRKLELVGGLIATISSGGVIGATMGFGSTRVGALMGAIGFVSAAVPQVVAWLRGIATGEGTVAENFVKLRECTFEAVRLERELQQPTRISAEVVARAEGLARTMFATLTNLGYMPHLRSSQT